jgi:hypothetical protein
MKPNKQQIDYKNFIPMINAMCFSWAKRSRMSRDELRSLINLVFCNCYNKFKPGRGEFINYFRSTIKKVIKETIDLDKNSYISEITEDSIQLESTIARPDTVLIFKDTIEALSKDAQFVVRSILSGRNKTIGELSYMVGSTTRGVIRTFLRSDLKWSHKKIDVIFREIEEALWDT